MKNCLNCKKEFNPNRKGQIYCNKYCQVKHWHISHSERITEIKNNYYDKNKKEILKRNLQFKINFPEKVEKSKKKYNFSHKKEIRERSKWWVINNPEKKKAQGQAQYRIFLNEDCDICHSKKNLERHHWDYNFPLKVNTLCKPCHKIQHVKHFENWRTI